MTWSYDGFKRHTHFHYRSLLVPVMGTRGCIPGFLLKARLKKEIKKCIIIKRNTFMIREFFIKFSEFDILL